MKMCSLRTEAMFLLTFIATTLDVARGHGRLIEPPARATAWRYGFSTRTHYDDDALNCGGYGLQRALGGKCGICGDPYTAPQPRDNEGGGKYGAGVIVRAYIQGDFIQASVIITVNHKGTFEFSLCRHNSPFTPADEGCFVKLQLADGSGTVYKMRGPYTDPITYTMYVQLPQDVICDQCVFRWEYRTGNNWGCDTTGNQGCGLGHGAQEHFMGCSDIRILARTGSNPPRPTYSTKRPMPSDFPNEPSALTTQSSVTRTRSTTETVIRPIPPGREYCDKCVPKFRWRLTGGMTEWCVEACRAGDYKLDTYAIGLRCVCE